MELTISISGDKRNLYEADEHWIIDQIEKRRREGVSVCVQVIMRQGDINIILSTPTDVRGGRGGRPPSKQEKDIIDLWQKMGLNEENFHGGKVIAFRAQLRKLL